MLARTGGSKGAAEGCGSLLPWHWPGALVVERLAAALELFGRHLRQILREGFCRKFCLTAVRYMIRPLVLRRG
jgi:hypothetical protein